MKASIFAVAAAVATAYAVPTGEVEPIFGEAVTPESHAIFRRQYPVLPCSHTTGGLHFILAGGANSANPKVYGLIYTLAEKVLAALPGSTNVSLPYNKQFIAGSSPPQLMPGAVTDGMATLKTYIENYHYACPNTKIALAGYSSGAVITMNSLCYGGDGVKSPQINPKLAGSTIVATVLYGDETRTANQPYNRGTCTINGYQGLAPRSNPGLCGAFVNHMASYCDLHDPDCCVGSTPYDVNVHLSYDNTYDNAATTFIVGQFRSLGGA